MSKLTILTASNGKNLELASSLQKISQGLDLEAEVVSLVDLNLPLYSTEEEDKGIPEKAGELAKKLQDSRALLFVAPEYNGSVPPSLNNAIAWVSRSSKDWRGAFNGKVAAVATHSGGGGLHVLAAMRQQLSYIGVNVLGRQLQTNFNKELNEDSAKDVIGQLIKLTNA